MLPLHVDIVGERVAYDVTRAKSAVDISGQPSIVSRYCERDKGAGNTLQNLPTRVST